LELTLIDLIRYPGHAAGLDNVTAWNAIAPWRNPALVEQDLVLSRALVVPPLLVSGHFGSAIFLS